MDKEVVVSRGLGRGAWRDRPELAAAARDDIARLGWDYAMRFSDRVGSAAILDLLAALDGKDLAFLRSSRFLLASETKALLAAEENLILTMPKARRTQFDAMQEARGRIDWPATVKERLSRGNDKSWLAVQQADWHAASAERRALAWVLDQIAACWKNTSRHKGLSDVATTARRLRHSTLLTDVPRMPSISARDRQALRQSRSKYYREEVEAAIALHEELFGDGLDELRRRLGADIWLPPEDDKVFEVWVLFILVGSLIDIGWTVSRMALMRPGAGGRVAFEMHQQDVKVELRFQSLAPEVESGSIYNPMLTAYQLGDGDRRPDICVTAEGPSGTRHLLVEVKLTEDRDYLSESIYKVFGYLHDYAEGMSGTFDPKAALIVWSGIDPAGFDAKHPLRILDAPAVRSGVLANMISSIAQQVA